MGGGCGDSITVSGGTVTALGGELGAGIGAVRRAAAQILP